MKGQEMQSSKSVKSLSDDLGTYFSAKTALAAGYSYNSLERALGKDFIRPLYGIYIVPEQHKNSHNPQESLRKNHLKIALAYNNKLPLGHFYSHFTAAVIWGLPVSLPSLTPIWTSRFKPNKPLTIKGMKSTACVPRLTKTTTHKSMRVTSPIDTWISIVPFLTPVAAVAAGDALLYHERMPGSARFLSDPLATKEDLLTAIMLPHRRKREQLLELSKSLSTQSASPPESHLRLFLTEWGYPPERLDLDVYGESGKLLGCSEIAYPSRKVVFEYEGDHHRTQKKQWYRDIEKYNAYREAGWSVVRVTPDLLYGNLTRLREIATRALVSQNA